MSYLNYLRRRTGGGKDLNGVPIRSGDPQSLALYKKHELSGIEPSLKPHVKTFDLSKTEDVLEYEDVLEKVCHGLAVRLRVPFEKVYDPDTKNWRVSAEWADLVIDLSDQTPRRP